MTFEAHQPKVYTNPRSVFEAVHLSQRLTGIAATFGRKEGKALSVLPRIRWELGRDRFSNGQLGDFRAIVNGDDGTNDLVHIEEFTRRDVGVVVSLYESDDTKLNVLLINFLGALSEILRATDAYSVLSGETIEPESDSVDSWCYRLQISIRLVCADTLPATYPTTITGSLQ